MKCLNLLELLALETVVIALIAYITSIVIPEVRSLLRIDPPKPKSAFAEKVIWVLLFTLICLAIGLIIWFLLCRLGNVDVTEPPPPSPTPQISPTPKSPIVQNPPIQVSGAEFTLYVFLQEYHWKKGKVDIEFNKQTKTEKEMIAYLYTLSGVLKDADAIICIGTASRDIEEGKDEPFEEGRAFTRAEQLILWMRPVISGIEKPLDIYNLNLGHYRELPDMDEQRLVALVKVKKVDPDISVDDLLSLENSQILKQKLKERGFKFSFDSYSLFDLRKKT